MKLVELLAKELSEWPKGDNGNDAITQDKGGILNSLDEGMQPSFSDRDQCWEGVSHSYLDFRLEQAEDFASSVVTRAQWQAERDRQKGGEWKRHRGGAQPVEDGVPIEVRHRDGELVVTKAGGKGAIRWRHTKQPGDIMSYRVISQPQAEEVEVKDTTIGTLSYKVEIDTTEASQAIDDLTAKWDQIETPFKWRDEVTELNAYIEKYTRERDAIIERLASEGFALIPPVVSVVSEFSGADMSDWRNWKAGDIVEVIHPNDSGLSVGNRYTVQSIEEPDYIGGMPVSVIDDIGDDYWPEDDKYDGRLVFKFISRP